MAETRAVSGALDKSGDVSGNESASSAGSLYNSEIGGEGSEVIVGDLRLCRADL